MKTQTQSTFYDLLGVSEDASQDEIRKAYLKLAHRHHPDKTGGNKSSEEKLKQINEAYDTLKNPEKRKAYDAARANPYAGMDAHEGFSRGFSQQGFEFSPSFEDLFGDLFGMGRDGRRTTMRPGPDIETIVTVTLREVDQGTRKTLHLRDTPNGKSRRIEVTVPPGATDGMRLRLPGQGGSNEYQGPPGDLYAVIQVAPDPVFQREGDDLLYDASLSFADAALGTTLRVPTLKKSAEIRVPPGTSGGKTFRLKGLGLPRLGDGKRGDQLVRIQISVPTKLSPRERALLEEWRALQS